ncbi:PREDICTED: uncharacterized protein LOC104611322 isoform X1 [Nelumbo nucifera]|uniref:Uncharacterized protein LOC104611322 isoform X1 n=1 Tax=Nelumbo nucifera TaxID=4432 RepID=A0A1U8BIU2_NELNU|nr:PREDICTED: uncharacterized protein LOC104611322 isoform X1 [Nelumbo nucifera]
MGCLSRCSSSFRSSPEDFLGSLERYLYGYMGFRRATARNQSETQALYLDSVLTHRSGSVVMLSLIYSEILKMVRMWDLLNFDVEIYFPHDLVSLPRGYQKQKSKVADQSHIMTSQSLLAEVLRNLKEAFWPFKYDHTMSLFLRAAHAANCIGRPSILEQRSGGIEIASAKAIKHKAEYGVWNGDMRCALSACERLILLESGSNELRDYSVLLYHCGFYQESLHYLKLYQSLRNSCIQKQSSNASRNLEEDEVEKLMIRLNLILMEQGWTRSSCVA